MTLSNFDRRAAGDALTGDEAAQLIDRHRVALATSVVVPLGEVVGDRLTRGLARAAKWLRGRTEHLHESSTIEGLDLDAGWAVAVLLRYHSALPGEGEAQSGAGASPRFEPFLQAERTRRMRARRTAPLPAAAARALQESDQLNSAQVTRLHELFSLSRTGNPVTAAAHRALVEDCLDLVTRTRAGADRTVEEVKADFESRLVVLDPALALAVEREQARTATGSVARRRVLVVAGPESCGKRRFVREAAAALGRPLHRVRAAGLTTAASVRGDSPFSADPKRGLLVDAVLKTECLNPVVHIEGIDRLDSAEAERLAGHLADIVDQPNPALAGRYLPREFAIDGHDVMVVATVTRVEGVPAVLRDVATVVELQPPTMEQRRAIVETFLLPELRRAALDGDATDEIVLAPSVVSGVLSRHGGDVGLSDTTADLRVLVGAYATSDRTRAVDDAWAENLLGPLPTTGPSDRPGTLAVPVLVGGEVEVARLDVVAVPGQAGTLVPGVLDTASGSMIRSGVDGIRDAGWPLPPGLRVSLNIQSSSEPVLGPWLSSAAVLAAASLAANIALPSVLVLGVVGGPGLIEPIATDVVDPRRLVAVMGADTRLFGPDRRVDAEMSSNVEHLLARLGLVRPEYPTTSEAYV